MAISPTHLNTATSVAQDDRPDLDFTKIFESAAPAAPLISVAEQKKIDDEMVIGAEGLENHGRYVRVVSGSTDLPPAPADARILVVEDDVATAVVIERVLQKSGYRVTRAHNRDEIIAGLNQLPLPDLVLLDVMLPDTSGFDVLARLRAHHILGSMRVMMLTSLNSPVDVGRGLALNVNGYLTKPIRPPVLVAAIAECLGRQKA